MAGQHHAMGLECTLRTPHSVGGDHCGCARPGVPTCPVAHNTLGWPCICQAAVHVRVAVCVYGGVVGFLGGEVCCVYGWDHSFGLCLTVLRLVVLRVIK